MITMTLNETIQTEKVDEKVPVRVKLSHSLIANHWKWLWIDIYGFFVGKNGNLSGTNPNFGSISGRFDKQRTNSTTQYNTVSGVPKTFLYPKARFGTPDNSKYRYNS